MQKRFRKHISQKKTAGKILLKSNPGVNFFCKKYFLSTAANGKVVLFLERSEGIITNVISKQSIRRVSHGTDITTFNLRQKREILLKSLSSSNLRIPMEGRMQRIWQKLSEK